MPKTISVPQTSEINFFPLTIIETYYPKIIFLNPMTGGLIVIHQDSMMHQLLSAINQLPAKLTLNNFVALFSDQFAIEDITKAISDFVSRGLISINNYLKSTTSSNHQYNRLLAPIVRNVNLCIFHLHDYCNLACTYCYLKPKEKKKTIKLDTMLVAAEKIYQSGSQEVCFEFHGGEPTMSMDLIIEFIHRLETEFAHKFRSIQYSIQTNAYLLKEEYIQFLAKKNFKVRVSIDGTEEIHDSCRITHNGGKTFKAIIKNIKRMLELNLYVETCTVIHDKNIDMLEEMYNQLKSIGVQGIRFLPVFKVVEKDHIYYLDSTEYFKKMYSLIEKVYLQNRNNLNLFSNLVVGELNAIQSFQRPYLCLKSSCGAGNEMIALDVNGHVFPCEEMIGIDELLLGDIHFLDLTKLKEHPVIVTIHNRIPENISKCRNCDWRELCHSGCPKKSYNQYHNMSSPSEMCSYYKNIFPALINLVYNQLERSGQYVITK